MFSVVAYKLVKIFDLPGDLQPCDLSSLCSKNNSIWFLDLFFDKQTGYT